MKELLGTALLKLLAYKCNKRVIISTYTSYEWITTINTRSLRLAKLAYWLKGWRTYNKYNSNAHFERYDKDKNQITYYTPW